MRALREWAALTGAVALGVCLYHTDAYGNQWAASNRLMCDLVHRQQMPPRLPVAEREEMCEL